MPELLDWSFRLGMADAVGVVGEISGYCVLADLFEIQRLFLLANKVGYVARDLAASDGGVVNDDELVG
ncbi:MAG: hypothetical protein ACK42H_01555 [Planctomycetota bacterium]|jgi:hypothetical protein